MPKIIPVLCTSANHLTPAHIELLKATVARLSPSFEIPKCIISPVNDFYLTQVKHYPAVTIEGASFARSIFNGQERLQMAKATLTDTGPISCPIEVSDFEITHTSIPQGQSTRGYIEHYEMLKYLQKQEIERSLRENNEPALYVLVAGTDLIEGMNYWNFIDGFPYIGFLRDGNSKEYVSSKSPQNYLASLNYKGDAFNNFHSGVYSWVNNPYAFLSSTQLAQCKPQALQTMGSQALTQLLSILEARANSDKLEATQKATAQATLQLIKRQALANTLGSDKKRLIETLYPPQPIKKPASPSQSSTTPSLLTVSLIVLGGFIAVLGIATVALAVTFNILTWGLPLLIGGGLTATLIGVGIFARASYNYSKTLEGLPNRLTP